MITVRSNRKEKKRKERNARIDSDCDIKEESEKKNTEIEIISCHVPSLILFNRCSTLWARFGRSTLGFHVFHELLIFFRENDGTRFAFMPFLLANETKMSVAGRAFDMRGIRIPDDRLSTLLVDTPPCVGIVLEIVEDHELEVLVERISG